MTMPTVQDKAQALYQARVTQRPITPFTDREPGLGMADGYAIQRELVAMLLADGDRVIGYKAGLTSAPMQRMFGVDTPDYGPVLASTRFANGDTISVDSFIAPKVEAEIVFRLGSRLAGPGVSRDQAYAAITEAIAGLEIVDSRIEDWRVKLADTVADLASNGAVVLADHAVPIADIDPRLIGINLAIGHVASGAPGTSWQIMMRRWMPYIKCVAPEDIGATVNATTGALSLGRIAPGPGVINWTTFYSLLRLGGYSGAAENQLEYSIVGGTGTSVSLNNADFADSANYTSGRLTPAIMIAEFRKNSDAIRARALAGGWAADQILQG